MTCVWKRLRDSKTGLMAGMCLAVIVIMFFRGSALIAATDPVLSFSGDWHPAGQEQDWLDQDRSWFRSLSSAEKFYAPVTGDPDSTTGQILNPEGMNRLRLRIAAAAAASGDPMTVVRPVASRLRDRWMDRGYLTVSVVVRSDSLLVRPGSAWTIGILEIGGDDFPGRQHLLATWLPRSGDRFKPEEWNEGIDMVLVGAGEAGYPFPRWVTREVELVPGNHLVTIKAILLPGKRAFIGPVTSDLTEERAARFLARSAGLFHGNEFRHSDLDRARQRLLARDLYTTVGEPRVYLTSSVDTVGIHIPVVARRHINRLQVVLGLSRREDGSGSRLSGEVDLRLPNMAGTGRSLQIGWRDDGDVRSRFGFSYLEPLAFGTPLDMGLSLDNEVEEESYTRFRLDNVWRLPVVALWGIELGVGWDRVTYPVGSLERSSRVRARGAVLHRRGDRTKSGWEGLFAIETARRSATLRPADATDTPSTAQLAESVNQRIFEVDSSGELWLTRTLSLGARASFRQLTGGDPVVPLSEQFRFGGAASLRGYREGVFHGSMAAWGSVEVLIGRPAGSRLYTFYDLGYFEFRTLDPLAANPEDLLQIRGWPRGYGLGILAVTPAGDISLAVGFPGTVDFDQAKLHVTLLETF